ncbi:hypothetical protein IFM89_009036 [Coptis chinensis]|uniref:Transposase n=1 Tax=Coptis chinensis TaxID=261450 RepID=A0A835IX46_9MAGN|nr:hypothetical protein IFM89_009036 [Coptis chinensis]
MAKKEKVLLHVVIPRDINEEMTESSKQGTKRIEKEKASIYAALTRNENGGVRFIDSTTKGSNQGTRNVEKGKASLYVERGRNKKIEFDVDGQAVGDDSYSYSSAHGGTAKTHCLIFYESFKDVPSQTKRSIWKKIKDEYGIAEVYKKCQLKKFAKSWREYNHRIRVKHYDKYDNDDERKRHCPEGVKREDWDRFVDNEAKPSRKQMWLVGKNSRKALKLLHTSGRRRAASTIHNLKKKNPNVKITRTHSYMAIHTRKDGSFLAPERMARINVIIEDDPSSIDLDLDNDPVAQVCGPDQYGHVLGMGVGVSKTSLIASGPAKEKLHQETQQRTMVEERVGTI